MVDGQYSTQGWNRYSYVKNNPIIYKDPTGHNINERFNNWLHDKGWVDNSTVAWGAKQEQNIQSNFLSDTRLGTEKKVADMEAKGLNTDRINKQLTDLRNKYNCRAISSADKMALQQYKESLSASNDSTPSGKIVKPIANSRITYPYQDSHKAIDVSNGIPGSSIVAAKSGVVQDIPYQSGYYDKDGNPQPGAGRYIITKNDDYTYSLYMHTQEGSASVVKDQKIKAGTKIAKTGNTGNEVYEMKDHLHYEERDKNGQRRRPIEVESLYK